jgi:hypothetical protein
MTTDDDPPVEVRSPLESSSHAAEVGFVAGATGQSILQAVVTLHWRDVLRATRERRGRTPQDNTSDPRFRQAGELPEGVHRPGE